ncbi:pyruvate formate-lyase-activating protein [Anaerolentibacter hominis]|uniref:pyruvate formate-lyase-activating protein n=1 Tax=Anaerolentibacter hominis TaxID=3079009 RepID=UPI0031B808CC
MNGRIHSFQSLGTLDGPGIRFVIFMQGCPLRCGYCHNPDAWDPNAGTLFSAEELLSKILRYRSYFGREGGVTVSGGEALLQAEFVTELFTLCREAGIHTALDTSGYTWKQSFPRLLSVTDLCLLDMKMTTEADYRNFTGASLNSVLFFLEQLDKRNIPTWIRQVIVPELNDNKENIQKLAELIRPYACIEKAELLPFRKLCKSKYDALKIPFPFDKYTEASEEEVAVLQNEINQILYKQ